MAPEVVNDTIDVTSFSAFKSADMYSASLVFWELCRQVFTFCFTSIVLLVFSLPLLFFILPVTIL